MRVYYELTPDAPAQVMKVEEPTDGQPVGVEHDDKGRPVPGTGYVPSIRTYHGMAREVRSLETDGGATGASGTTYYHGVCNLTDGSYGKDPDDTAPIVVDGVAYPLGANGEVFIPRRAPLPAVSNEALSQQLSDLEANLIIAGVI
jgi:hypothetical protein